MTAAVPVVHRVAPDGALTIAAVVRDAASHSPDLEADWTAIMEKIVALHEVGGFGEPEEGGVAGLALLATPDRFAPANFRSRFVGAGLSRQVVEAAVNAARYFDARVHALASLSVDAPARDLPRPGDADPAVLLSPSYALHDERELFEGGFQVEVFFEQPQPDANFVDVEDAFGRWFSAVNIGVFASPSAPADRCFVHLGDDSSTRAASIRLSVGPHLFAEPEGTNALLAVFEWCDRHVARIARVELYE